jgi:alkanesulfonate monooxygenase SsuD/methylene tetrahydromethanopterin reductase-like flavin-dependent oxidoreductase (luciferase family)
MAHQISTLDQVSDGRTIIGVGIATDQENIRNEFMAAGVPFEKRVGRMLEGLRLCRALWSGDAVDWDGRWTVKQGVLGPMPVQKNGPPIWIGGGAEANIKRVGEEFDGWFPITPDAELIKNNWQQMQTRAKQSARDVNAITCAAYLTLSIEENIEKAQSRADQFLSSYYGARPDVLKKIQACYAGPLEGAVQYLQSFINAGASHLVLRFAGDHDKHLELMSKVRERLK